MAFQGMPKMSLVAQFDDLCRYTNVLTAGPEEEFKIFVENQLNNLQKWKGMKDDVKKLHEKISSLETEKKRLETQMKHLRNLFEAEIERRKKVELEKHSMERQIALIKEVLLADGAMDNQTKEKLAFLNSTSKPISPPRLETIEESVGSLFSLMDVTEDDLIDTTRKSSRRHRGSKEKRSSSETRHSSKKKKIETEEEESDESENIIAPYKTRSSSEPAQNSPESHAGIRQGHRSDSDQVKYYTCDLRRYNTSSLNMGTPIGRYSTGGKLSRAHSFAQKTVIRTEKCYPCGKIVKFCKQVLKCQDCRVICHPECKDRCPLPCTPSVCTPTKGVPGTIADYVSSAPPMIPSLIVHCINEIESRGFKEIGLYRISGSEREVKDLKEKFLRGRSLPSLNQIDIHAVCGTVKEFLRSLKEPLVTRAAWQTFVEASDVKDIALSLSAMYENVMDLPQPNRDTLVFLLLHLQRVAESPHCRMPVNNLAKVFGPTIVGYSSPDPTDTNMFSETTNQCKVMERLLSLPSDSLQSLLNVENDVFPGKVKTPEIIHATQGSRLGPLLVPGQRAQTINFGRTTPTSRSSKSSKYSKPGRMEFSSPLIKKS